MKKFRDGPFGPTVILFTICFVITLSLAFTEQITRQQIVDASLQAANEVRSQVLTSADSFVQIKDVNLPQGVLEAYKADNGSGFVFSSQAKGYDGMVTFMVGIDANGEVVGINMFDHNETPGLGTKVGQQKYLDNFYGSVNEKKVDAISGATRTSNALKNSLSGAKAAYEAVKGVG